MLLGMLLVVGVAVDVSSGVVIQGVDVLRVGQRGAAVIVCVAVLGLLGLALTGEALLRRTDRLPAGATVRRFSEALRSLLARPARGLAALGLSVLIWAVTIAAVQRALAAFPGLPSGPLEALTTWALTLAGMTAIPTPGFFGGYEAACSTTLGMLGADATRAGAFAILLHLGQFAFTIAIGVACLLKEGLDLRSVVQQSRTHVSG
jgi:uncharacterized membrane protein YbhN (UPF0104 family)